jgi:hypothetical protein
MRYRPMLLPACPFIWPDCPLVPPDCMFAPPRSSPPVRLDVARPTVSPLRADAFALARAFCALARGRTVEVDRTFEPVRRLVPRSRTPLLMVSLPPYARADRAAFRER